MQKTIARKVADFVAMIRSLSLARNEKGLYDFGLEKMCIRDRLTAQSRRIAELIASIDEKTMRWLELSER